MDKYFLTKRQATSLFTDGPLNTFAAWMCFLVPTILLAVGVITVIFFGAKYTFSQLLVGVGVLLFAAVCLPFAFQKPRNSQNRWGERL